MRTPPASRSVPRSSRSPRPPRTLNDIAAGPPRLDHQRPGRRGLPDQRLHLDVLLYKDQPDAAKGKALVDFLWWATHDGQAMPPAAALRPAAQGIHSRWWRRSFDRSPSAASRRRALHNGNARSRSRRHRSGLSSGLTPPMDKKHCDGPASESIGRARCAPRCRARGGPGGRRNRATASSSARSPPPAPVAPVLLILFLAVLLYGAWPAISAFGFSFLTIKRLGAQPGQASSTARSPSSSARWSARRLPCASRPRSVSPWRRSLTRSFRRGSAGASRFVIEILATIPSVVYGLWGVFVLAPWVMNVLARRCWPARWVSCRLFGQPEDPRNMLCAVLMLVDHDPADDRRRCRWIPCGPCR